MNRLLVLLATAALAVVIGERPAPAAADAALVETTPARGAKVQASDLRQVTFVFNESITARFTRVVVTGPAGRSVTNGAVTVDRAKVTQPIQATDAGTYTAAYRAVSADGHPVTGTVEFDVVDASGSATTAGPSDQATASGEPDSPPTNSPTDDTSDLNNTPLWIGAVGATLVVMLMLAWRRRGRGRR